MSNPEFIKTRKPRMKAVVNEIVRQKSLEVIPVETRTVFLDNDKKELQRIKDEIDTIRDNLEQRRRDAELLLMYGAPDQGKTESMPENDFPPKQMETGFNCGICNKIFKRNTPELIDRHERSFYHKQSVLRQQLQTA